MNTSPTQESEKSEGTQTRGALHKPWWQLVLFALAHLLIFSLLFHTIYKIPNTGTDLYFEYSTQVLHGYLPFRVQDLAPEESPGEEEYGSQYSGDYDYKYDIMFSPDNVPYREYAMEYPPFSLFFFIPPRLITSTYSAYVLAYQAEVLIFDLVGLWLIYTIARRLGKAPWKMLSVYTLSLLAIGPIISQQYDIFPAILVLLAIYCFWLGKHKTSWALLALGAMTKFYPAVIAPIFLLYYIRNRQYRHIWSGILTFAATTLVVALPFLIINADSIWGLLSYHSQREIQIESTYSAFLMAADKLGLIRASVTFGAGSWNLSGPLIPSPDNPNLLILPAITVATISTYVLALLLLTAYWFIYGQMKPGKIDFTRLGAYSLLVVTITLIGSKVLSPQYFIWLIPLMPLVFGKWRYAIWIVFLIIGALTYYIFPGHYSALLALKSGPAAVLLVRNILLILLAVFVGISLRRTKAQIEATESHALTTG